LQCRLWQPPSRRRAAGDSLQRGTRGRPLLRRACGVSSPRALHRGFGPFASASSCVRRNIDNVLMYAAAATGTLEQ